MRKKRTSPKRKKWNEKSWEMAKKMQMTSNILNLWFSLTWCMNQCGIALQVLRTWSKTSCDFFSDGQHCWHSRSVATATNIRVLAKGIYCVVMKKSWELRLKKWSYRGCRCRSFKIFKFLLLSAIYLTERDAVILFQFIKTPSLYKSSASVEKYVLTND